MLSYVRVDDRALKLAASSLLILILALILNGAFAVEKSTASTAVDHDVIIIGAGSAGQYAAYELDYLGFDVLVLEARPRRHGMLHPPQVIGSTEVHPMAESVTGSNAPNWHYADIVDLDPNRLVRRYPWGKNDDRLYSVNGSTVLGTDVTRGKDPEIYDYWDFYYDQSDYTGPDIDVETYLCDTLAVCRGDADFHLYRSGFPGADWMTRLDHIGMRSLAEMESLWDLSGGPQVFAYSSWTDTLDELYFDDIVDKVELNHTVTDVDTSGAVAAVTAVDAKCSDCHSQPGPNRGVPIPDTGNHPRVTMTANAVVSTLPVGVLKAGDVTFTPPLPASKLWALNHLGVGNGGKMFLEFSSRVWPTTTNIFLTEGVAGYCWDYEYRGGNGGAVMTCYTVGENADALDAMGSDAARISAVVSDLDTMYPGTPFSGAFVTGFWKRTDDMLHSKGAYTYPMPGSYPTDGSPSAREVLAEPVGTTLYFAGAPTHNSWASTVVGALDTGLRVAGEIDADHDPVPEPRGSTMLLAGAAFLGLLYRRRVRGSRLG
jgi:monoamine oxidase